MFFSRGLPGTVIVTEKFKKFCVDGAESNCTIIPAEAYSFDFYPWEKHV